jgi:hypothetical protein
VWGYVITQCRKDLKVSALSAVVQRCIPNRSQRFEDLRRTEVCGKLQSLEHLLRRFDQAGDRVRHTVLPMPFRAICGTACHSGRSGSVCYVIITRRCKNCSLRLARA